MKNLWIVFLLCTLVACNNDDDGPTPQPPEASGLSFALSENESSTEFTDTYTNLRTAIQNNGNVLILSEVDHEVNASNVGEDLRPTRLIFFGNPSLGTPIMQENQLAGLDLPQKMLVYQNSNNDVYVSYNATSYLAARYNVGGAATLQQVNTALRNFAETATNGVIDENPATVTSGQGVVTVVSQNDFATTYNTLRNAISDNPNLNIIFELDHQVNAQSVGLTLNPTRVIVFGNPELGTTLMQDSQTAGIDLPQKMLVWEEDDGTVNISYNNAGYIATRHGSTGNTDVISTINSALASLAVDAAN